MLIRWWWQFNYLKTILNTLLLRLVDDQFFFFGQKINKSRILFLLTKNEKKNSWNLKLTNCNNKFMKGQYWKKIWFFVKNKQNKTNWEKQTTNLFFEPNFVFLKFNTILFLWMNEWMNNDYDDYLYLNGPITGPMNEWMNECIS